MAELMRGTYSVGECVGVKCLQGRSSRILIGAADFPPPTGEVWFLGLGG